MPLDMRFNSIEYAVLLVAAITVSWLFKNRQQVRIFSLLVASYIFYAAWHPAYLVLIFFSSSLDFAIGRQLHTTQHPAYRRALLALSVATNLGILCTFKYFNFFVGEITALLGTVGIPVSTPYLDVLLPVGISFYTFQTMSYVIDVYRCRLTPTKRYFSYLLFVSFFPQLVAGPIVRARVLLPELSSRPTLSPEAGSRALYRIGMGLVKKIAIADFLGAHIVDPVFSNPEMYTSIETLAAIYAYAFQIYTDFSAYSDIAIGSAMLLGVRIPENFRAPYRSGNLREFWQRWHISLSTWLRDYLYIPLGGSRRSRHRVYANLMITMVLGGLWHGAASTFLAWGTLHGVALAITRAIQRPGPVRDHPNPVRRILAVACTFHFVCGAWVVFRSDSLATAVQIFQAVFSFTSGMANLSFPIIAVILVAALSHWIPDTWIKASQRLFHAAPAPVQAAALIAAILVITQIAQSDVAPFIYFQF
ncbi:MAG: MBOAT family protein [Myxococcota bacterium]|nr:MBOAT family protein [Myxococcota bacterium]